MSFNKKILATAIVGGLFATAAQAQVVLNTDGVSTGTAARFGSELATPFDYAPATAANDHIRSALGYNFSDGDVKHVRIECSSNARITSMAVPTLTTLTAGTDYSIGAVNGTGTSAVFFSITDLAGGTPLTANLILNADPAISVRSQGLATCSFALYDEASQASTGGATGRISTSVTSGRIFDFAPSYAYSITPGSTTISSSANPIYSAFSATTGVNGAANARIGVVNFNLVNLLPSSTAVARVGTTGVALLLSDLLGSNSQHIVEGDMSALANEDGTFTGDALGRIYIDNDSDCSNTAPTDAFRFPTALTATSATFTTGAAAVANSGICFVDRAGVQIPTASYTIRFAPQPANATVAPAAIAATNLGSLLRDGTDLVAPFVQVPAGWTSRIVLNNTSSVARPYTISVQGETGNTITTNAGALTGTIPARGTTVIDVPSFLTGFTGSSRASVNVSIAAPRSSVNGLYQIVNGATGSISNHVMVANGTN